MGKSNRTKTSEKLIIELYYLNIQFHHKILKTVLSGHSKTDKKKGLKAMWYLNAGQKYCRMLHNTLKPVLSGHSKTDKTKVLKPCGTLMQVKSTAECSTGYF